MIIIGEKINGTIPSVAAAIERRDACFISNLALAQIDAGADYLDICAGTSPELETDALIWLIQTVQDSCDALLCIDSPDPHVLASVLPMVRHPGIVNSVSDEGEKCAVLLPLIAKTKWKVIILTCDDNGIPYDATRRVIIAENIIHKALSFGIDQDRIFVDPLVMALSAVNDSLLSFVDALSEIKRKFPDVKTTSGLSNISFGMPLRKTVNLHFLALSIFSGMDSAIIDPASRDIRTTILATEALMGKDKHCRNYIKAYRSGLIGPTQK